MMSKVFGHTSPISSIARAKEAEPISIDCQDEVYAVAFLPDGKHFVVDTRSKIRHWTVEGKEDGNPIYARSAVYSIVVTRDGKWIVSGMENGEVAVWNAETHEKATAFEGHGRRVRAVDVSLDGSRIVSGSDDKTACVWSFSGERLLGPLQHDGGVVAAKFSCDGSLIATAMWCHNSVRVYAESGLLLVDADVRVKSWNNGCLAWASDKRLFALSSDDNIHCLDVFTGTTLSKWSIQSTASSNTRYRGCIALATDDTFIAASTGPHVSLWDTITHQQIGSVINHPDEIQSMAMSASHTLVLGGKTTTIRNINGMLPLRIHTMYEAVRELRTQRAEYKQVRVETDNRTEFTYTWKTYSHWNSHTWAPDEQFENFEKTGRQLRDQLDTDISSLPDPCARVKSANNKNALFGEIIRKPHIGLSDLQLAAEERKNGLSEIISPSNNKVTRFEQTNEKFHTESPISQRAAEEEKENLNETIQSLRPELRMLESSSSRKITLPKQDNGELCTELASPRRAADEQKEGVDEIIRSLNNKIANLELDNKKLRADVIKCAADEQRDTLDGTMQSPQSNPHDQETSSNTKMALLEGELAQSQQKAEDLVRINCAYVRMRQCESLYTQGRVRDAAQSLSEMANTIGEDVKCNKLISDWLAEFTDRVAKALGTAADDALNAGQYDDAVSACFLALSLVPTAPETLLMKYIRTVLICGSVQEALAAATEFKLPMFVAYRVICDELEGAGCLKEAMECFQQMKTNLSVDNAVHDEQVQWEQDFESRCVAKLEKMGDSARESEQHKDAIRYYFDALKFDPANLDILLKHSDEFIKLNPSSYQGYEKKYSALHSMGRYGEAFDAFKTMLSILECSPDPSVRQLHHQYIDATSAIQKEVDEAIREIPSVLIDTDTGRLYDKRGQANAFRELPIYDELRSSMTSRVDTSRIRKEVKEFYQYVMLSHKWQPHEPTFQQVANESIYKVSLSPEFSKLQNFCKLACSLRFKWAWVDTCCVNQLDKSVQQESVVAMFRWYRGSSLTLVHLLGVLSGSKEIGHLRRSIWNTRGWTYQEYIASKVVQFYTEDWKPYLGMDTFNESAISNHKLSPVILEEMEQAMNFATKELTTLQPGIDRVREKLYLASRRQTTREEDIAYSLFGIFGVALSVIYGEGNQAVGRLLEHILTRSADVTILAWTGRSGGHHSYLPVELTVYDQIDPPHIPPPIESAAMDEMTVALQSSSLDLTQTEALYNQLYKLSSPSLVAGRLKLSGIVFPLHDLVHSVESDPDPGLPVYRATTPLLGDVKIVTTADLSSTRGLLLIHPWINPLLDRDFLAGVPQYDLATRALRLVVRLRQPFGALLLAPLAREQYRRVATDSLIMVRLCEHASLRDLMDSVHAVDIQ